MRPPPSRPWVIAHRGASAAFRENTVEAFHGAAAMGADAVEIDVRRTADGQPLVHHDAVVAGLGPIVSLTAADLRRRAPWVPTLEEALGACAGMWVDVEVKNSPADPDWDPGDSLAAVLATRLPAGEGLLVSSFNAPTLERLRGLRPDLPTGLLTDRALPPEEAIAAAAGEGHPVLLPHAATLAGPAAEVVVAAHRAGLLIVAWTVDDPPAVRRLAAAGIDGIITNRPDVAVRALQGAQR